MRHKEGAWGTHEVRGLGNRTDEKHRAVFQISQDVTDQTEDDSPDFRPFTTRSPGCPTVDSSTIGSRMRLPEPTEWRRSVPFFT
jgi:hypothetical protein